jgi:hypothetical protein
VSANPAGKTIYAPEGYGFRVGRGRMLIRKRSRAEEIEKVFAAEFKRCGWGSAKCKVTEIRALDLPPEKAGNFFLNLGYLRGLDPEAAYAALKALPDKCGHRRVLEAISKLPERVEVAVPVSEVVG